MNTRGLHSYVDDLLDGRRPRPFDADGFEAVQIRTAIELRAARTGSEAPSEHFLTDLHRRLAARVPGARETPVPLNRPLDQLRCPCHSTSFSPTGQVLSRLLRIAPDPLPRLDVRERDGSIEVFVAERRPPSRPEV
jgi:hypothetical protein